MKAKKEPYLDYEIMTLDMKTLKREVKKCLRKGNEDYLNELFIYGCWGNKSELVNSDGDAISKAITLLHQKSFNIIGAIKKNYSVKVIKTLLDGGTNPNLKNEYDQTALMYAAVNGCTQAVQELLKHPGTNPNVQDNDGCTALMFAARDGVTQAVQELLKHPVTNPNVQDNDGWTALMYAEANGKTQAVQELLSHPAIDISITNNDGRTAWDVAKPEIREQFPELHPRYKDDNIKNNQIILLKEISKELLQIVSTDVKDKERIRAITLLIKKL